LICEPQDWNSVTPKTGLDAAPRISLNLGHQIFDEPSGSDQQAGPSEERIGQRASGICEKVAQATPKCTGIDQGVSWNAPLCSQPSLGSRLARRSIRVAQTLLALIITARLLGWDHRIERVGSASGHRVLTTMS